MGKDFRKKKHIPLIRLLILISAKQRSIIVVLFSFL